MERKKKIGKDFYNEEVIKDTVSEIITPEQIIVCNSCANKIQGPVDRDICPHCGIRN